MSAQACGPDGPVGRLEHGRAVWLMVAVTLLWSTAGVVTRHLEHAAGFEVTFWRSAFTVLSLLVILPAWRGWGVFASLATGGRALWISGACWSVMFTAFMVALTLTTTANVLITMAAGPLFTALAARLFIGHRLPPRTWGAIALAGVGIAWMYGRQFGQGPMTGTLIALCVPIALAGNWTVVQHASAGGRDVDLAPAVLIGAALSAIATAPLAFPSQASLPDLGLLAFLGLFQLAIPCVLAMQCARVLQAPEVALLGLLEVIFGIGLAWAGAGEVPAPAVLGGGSLVIAALMGNECLGLRERGRPAAGRAGEVPPV